MSLIMLINARRVTRKREINARESISFLSLRKLLISRRPYVALVMSTCMISYRRGLAFLRPDPGGSDSTLKPLA